MKHGFIVKTACVIPLAFSLSACDDDDDLDFYRSSNSIPTEKISMYVQADVHTHFGQGEEPDESHTTLHVEFYGYAKRGYFYTIELAEADVVSGGIDNELVELLPEFFPDEHNPVAVSYYHDFNTTEAGTSFEVVFDRDVDAGLHSSSVVLPAEADFNVTPESSSIELTNALTLTWSEADDYEYSLIFRFICEEGEQVVYQSLVRYPNWNVETVSSPFNFKPSDFFNPTDTSATTNCELRSTLKTYSDQTPDESSTFDTLSIRATREQNAVKTLTF